MATLKVPSKYSAYINPDAPLEEPERHYYCPWHGPAPGGAVLATRTDNGYFIYCFNCKGRVFIPSPKMTARQTKSMLAARGKKEAKSLKVKEVWLPHDFSLDIPNKGLMWLRRYGITDTEIAKYRFGYSEYRNRLIIPVFQGTDLVYWQGRLLNKPCPGSPKYTNVTSNRSGVYFMTSNVNSHNGTYVLVEDVLSAIALERAGYRGVALLGCHVDNTLIRKLQADSDCKNVLIWLDPDKRSDAVKYAKRCNSLGLKAKAYITAKKDPKEYNATAIQKMLKDL